QAAMLAEHALVAAELVGVAGRPAEHLAPPTRHMVPVVGTHTAREERRQQVIALDPVIEGVDQPLDGLAATGPLVERRRRGRLVLAHPTTVASVWVLLRVVQPPRGCSPRRSP